MSDMLLIEELKRIVRVRSADAEFELEGLIASCKKGVLSKSKITPHSVLMNTTSPPMICAKE